LSVGQDDEASTKKGKEKDEESKDLKAVYEKINLTFKSILIFNWILVSMGIAAFIVAIISAFVREIALTALFGALGTADVISLFKFSMDRVQRSLGDQVQIVQANRGLDKEIKFIEQVKPGQTGKIDEVRKIIEEIRTSTLNSMQLIQSFTKIAEPLNPEPWIRALPIRYGKLQYNGSDTDGGFTVTKGKEFTLSGSLKNVSNKIVKINAIVIAVRPPGGTPDGGPFRFDFYSDDKSHKLIPHQSLTIDGVKKSIDTNMKTKQTEEIRPEWYRKDWYAFMTCQTEDGCWHDDHNKYWFEVKKA
jgi:hypothetical protein